MKTNNTFTEIKEVLDKANNILIISHILPDGDNIASVLGMAISLGLLGKNTTALCNGTLPQYYEFLPHRDKLVSVAEAQCQQYDLTLALDMSDKGRGGAELDFAYNSPLVVNIDHHISNDYFGDYNYVDPGAAATAQILTDFLLQSGYPLNKDIATSFYTGILTDSGNFTYGNTTAATLALASELLRYEPDLAEIRLNVFENVSFKRKKILGHILNNAVELPSHNLVYSTLTYGECQALKAEGQDFEGAIDHLIGVNNVKMALFFREMEPNLVKVGFRGRLGADVTVVAGKFGGGGHKAAGGCSVAGDFTAIVQQVLEACVEYMNNLEYTENLE